MPASLFVERTLNRHLWRPTARPAGAARFAAEPRPYGLGPLLGAQRAVEEADHAAVVLLRPGRETMRVGRRDLPDLLRPVLRLVVVGVVVLATGAALGVDEEDRRRPDFAGQALQVRRRRLIRE